ncbi:MAG: ATP-binding protein [Coprothermobacterota bacterium]|nr:ATP-binding protein [Coprothermobacterota bacterium]
MSQDDNKLFDILAKWNFWDKPSIEAGFPRTLHSQILPHIAPPEIIVIKGVRRSGKSTLMLQLMNVLRGRGVSPQDMLYINFEEPLFIDQPGVEILDRLYRIYRERINPQRFPYIFLDEIQQVSEWERWARVKTDLREAKLFVTGSAANLIGAEYSTLLTGRNLSFTVYPLGFTEFLSFKGCEGPFDPLFLARNEPLIRNLLREYLQFGGFPEVALRETAAGKEKLLKQYFEDLLYRDIVSRYRLRDVRTLKNIALYCMTNVSNLFSYTRLKNVLSVPLDVVRNYTGYMTETYMIREMFRHSFKINEQLRNPKKLYVMDNGLRNAVSYRFSEDLGRLAENAVYWRLMSQEGDIFYYKNRGEVDFLVRKGMQVTNLIQVSMIGEEEEPALRRELDALADAMQDLKIDEGTIITESREEILEIPQGKIRMVPLWKWLTF